MYNLVSSGSRREGRNNEIGTSISEGSGAVIEIWREHVEFSELHWEFGEYWVEGEDLTM